ncbi:MAG: FadR family transcriptional regulator [Limnochordia bacterium]|jgi:GntR family transcriptional repressor for pyruvate dehydrogenase complex|nr:FadR family transcriptional regulator [Limnochordia bacterium]MDD4518311.1 FadR/GntR family transcriptional regulator [Limnochordia bacterium]
MGIGEAFELDGRQGELFQLNTQCKRSLYQQIADRLKVYINEWGLQPGDKLPTEHELVKMFGVSRPSVREALRLLQSLGVVVIRQRHGVVVQAPLVSDLMEQLAYGLRFVSEPQSSLWEARLVLETGAVPLISARLTSEGLERLDQILQEMDHAIFAAPRFTQLDMQYHRTLMELAGNDIILELAKVIEDFFSHPRNQINATSGQRRLFIEEHWGIRNALAAHGFARAQQIIYRHLWRYHVAWGEEPQVTVQEQA